MYPHKRIHGDTLILMRRIIITFYDNSLAQLRCQDRRQKHFEMTLNLHKLSVLLIWDFKSVF